MATEARPLRADAERNRQKILAAARDVFAERGLSATLDDVAKAAGVGVGTVYRRFPDRDALIDELFEARFAEMIELADEALAKDDAWPALVDFMREFLSMQACDRGLKDLIIDTSRGRERVARVRENFVPRIQEIVQRAIADGRCRPDFSASDIPMISMMVGTIGDASRDVSPDLWARMFGLLLDGMCARRDEPTPLPVAPLTVEEVPEVLHGFKRR